ncbi:MAG: hypothetical protein LIP02_06415 [Bacteroidales bacterium]|nr:hypothetical protein [Bacteroidales bacterium]
MTRLLLCSIAALSMSFTACGEGSSTSTDDAMLFGQVPAIVAQCNEQVKSLREEWKHCKSPSTKSEIREKIERCQAETNEAVAIAAPEWSGATIDITSDNQFTVQSPVTATYDKMFTEMEPKYNLAGSIVVAKNYLVDLDPSVLERNPDAKTSVLLVGLDENGKEVISTQIGFAKIEKLSETNVIVRAGTPVNLEPIHMSSKKADQYLLIHSLHLRFYKYTK